MDTVVRATERDLKKKRREYLKHRSTSMNLHLLHMKMYKTAQSLSGQHLNNIWSLHKLILTHTDLYETIEIKNKNFWSGWELTSSWWLCKETETVSNLIVNISAIFLLSLILATHLITGAFSPRNVHLFVLCSFPVFVLLGQKRQFYLNLEFSLPRRTINNIDAQSLQILNFGKCFDASFRVPYELKTRLDHD